MGVKNIISFRRKKSNVLQLDSFMSIQTPEIEHRNLKAFNYSFQSTPDTKEVCQRTSF